MTDRDSGVGLASVIESEDENTGEVAQEIHNVVSSDSDLNSESVEPGPTMASEEELKRLAETTALLVPFIPLFKNDPLAKIDIKVRDIDRQVSNYNRRFKSWQKMIVIPNVPKSLWLEVWKSGLSDEALDVLEKLTYQASDDQEDYETVAKKMLEHLTNKRGSKFTARVQFRSLKQADKEPFNTFFLRLQSAAAPCRWNEETKKENMIEQLIAGHRDERVRAILFDLDTDDLEKYVRKCEALEIATLQAVQVVNPSTSNSAPLPVDSNQTRGHPYNRGAPRGRGNFPRGRGIFRGRNINHQPQGRCGWCGGQEHGPGNSERTIPRTARPATTSARAADAKDTTNVAAVTRPGPGLQANRSHRLNRTTETRIPGRTRTNVFWARTNNKISVRRTNNRRTTSTTAITKSNSCTTTRKEKKKATPS